MCVCCGEDSQHGEFSIYLLEDTSINPLAARFIPLDELELSEPPLLTLEEVVSYDWESHYIETVPGATGAFPVWDDVVPVGGITFVVVAQGEPRYIGGFWPVASSWPYNHPIIIVGPAPSVSGYSDSQFQILCGHFFSTQDGGCLEDIEHDYRLDLVVKSALEISGKLK